MRSNGGQRRLGDRVVRRPRARELGPLRIKAHHRRRLPIPASTAGLLMLSGTFAGLIALGTTLLMVPAATAGPDRAGFIEALFTATSAVCVTGLVVVSTSDYWSGFGQLVILLLMIVGGLGIMTAGLVIVMAIGRRITLNQRLIVRDTMGGASLGSMLTLGRYVVIFALSAQAVGFLALFAKLGIDHPLQTAAWRSLFHSASAFNNAGFNIFPDSASLVAFDSDPAMLAITGALVVVGALSFPVVAELYRRQRPRRWTLDTRLVIVGTLGMWAIGAVALALFELTNDATLGGMSTVDKISNGVFQAVTSRTAGFSSINFDETRSGTDFLYAALMFVGGASGSVAGGIKVNTFMVLVFAGLASVAGRERTEVFKRELPVTQVTRALAVFLLAAAGLSVFIVALAFTEASSLNSGAFTFMDVLFEAVSAFGTTGLSRGITPDLSDPGRIVVVLVMYVGRLGPLTIALGMALRERRAVYRFAQERVRIG